MRRGWWQPLRWEMDSFPHLPALRQLSDRPPPDRREGWMDSLERGPYDATPSTVHTTYVPVIPLQWDWGYLCPRESCAPRPSEDGWIWCELKLKPGYQNTISLPYGSLGSQEKRGALAQVLPTVGPTSQRTHLVVIFTDPECKLGWFNLTAPRALMAS